MYTNKQPGSIQSLFGSIAERYDLGNRVITLGLYSFWNARLVKEVSRYPVHTLLDLCSGTGEVACSFLKLNPNSHAILLDFCPEMLTIAKERCAPYKGRFQTLNADALSIPLPDESVDAITIAYGIRNVSDPRKCFEEVRRVLKPGGILGVLEGTRPHSLILRKAHRMYLRTVLPILGKLVANNKNAYAYLGSTIDAFTPPRQLESTLQELGFRKTWQKPLLGGATTLLFAEK